MNGTDRRRLIFLQLQEAAAKAQSREEALAILEQLKTLARS